MTEVERLPLIEDIARIFPNEWLAFIIAPGEDDDFEPTHGKLIAHSPDPDEVADAVNTVLWNQHVYVYFNGDFTALQASYGPTWEQEPRPASRPQAYSGPTQAAAHAPLASDPLELIYSALDQLYGVPKIHEAIRRLRLARVKMAATRPDDPLISILDTALNKLETSVPLAEDVIWYLEEALANLELV